MVRLPFDAGSFLAALALLLAGAGSSAGQQALTAPGKEALAVGDPLSVLGVFRLNDGLQPFLATLGEDDEFGSAIASLGDVDGNGNIEYAIGAPGDFLGRGAMWIFSLRPDRTVARHVKYGPLEELPFTLAADDRFGASVTALGDLDGDGIGDIAVGAPGDDDGLVPPFSNSGAVYILFLNSDGGIRTSVKFSRTSGGFPGLLDAGDAFGSATASAGDLDGNGTEDLLVGAPNDDDGGGNRGAVWVLFLAPNHTVMSARKISQTQGGFGGNLSNQDHFGSSLANLGDLDGDGRVEIAIGAAFTAANDVWIVSLAADGSVVNQVGSAVPQLSGALSAVNLGDVDGDGVTDLALGDARAEGGFAIPSIAVVFLNSNGTAKGSVATGRPNTLRDTAFGQALATPGDTDGDGRPELLVGLPEYSNRARKMGGMVIYNVSSAGTPSGASFLIDALASGVPVAPLFFVGVDSDYGRALAPLGDIDDDGFSDVAVGSPFDNDGGAAAGAVWIHHLSATNGLRVDKLSKLFVNLPLVAGDRFGTALAALGDLDDNGVIDLAVGAPGPLGNGGIWILFLNRFHRVQASRFLTKTDVGLPPNATIGRTLVSIGDLDGNGTTDLMVSGGLVGDHLNRIVLLNADGSVKASHAFDRTGVVGSVPGDFFGKQIADYGPLAGGGRSLLVVGTQGLWRVDLDRNAQTVGSLKAVRSVSSDFTSLGDLDGDGLGDMAVLDARVHLQLLNADLSIKQSSNFNAGRAPYALTALGDVTGDGVPDVAGTSRFNSTGSVFLTQLGGIATTDFELVDDADADLMKNGRALPLTGRTLAITSEGAHLGAAIFDSTPGGPNAFSQDPDLLVGSGKVLMLQDSLHGTQTMPGVFDQPNDDADGGTLHLTFRRLVKPLSLRLIDIDQGFEQRATVTLFDAAGRTRIYDVPAGFTEDRVQNGGTGWRKLDLTLLTPQAGFTSSATASQQTGFDASHVQRIDVELGSSGAIDNLIYDPYP